MSDVTFESAVYFPSPTDWYHGRAFKVAFAASVVIHGVLIAGLPGLRAVPPDSPLVLQVEIAQTEAEVPLTETRPVPPERIEPREEPVPQPRRLKLPSEPLVHKAPPERLLAPRADIVEAPRPEINPEFVVPKVQPRAPVDEPKIEPPPAPIARAEPPPAPAVDRAPDPLPDSRSNIVPDAKSV